MEIVHQPCFWLAWSKESRRFEKDILLKLIYHRVDTDSISRDEPDSPLTQYITNAGISRARYTITLFKHQHRVLRLIFNRISV